MIETKEFRKSTPAGIALFSKWFHPSRELFTTISFTGASRSGEEKKSDLQNMKGFLKVLKLVLSSVDKSTYGSDAKIKAFLMEYIKNARRTLNKFEKNK